MAYHKAARQAAEHAQSRTGDSRFDYGIGYRLTVTAQTPSLVTDLKERSVDPRLRASRRSRRVVENSRRRRFLVDMYPAGEWCRDAAPTANEDVLS